MNRLPTEPALEGLHFGENLRWRDGRLWFSDMYGDRVHRFDPVTGRDETVAELYHPAGLGWLPDGRLLAVATEDRRVFVVEQTGNHLYADLSGNVPAWANEMLVDASGRAIVGNFGYDLFSEPLRETHLMIIEPDGSLHRGPDGLRFPNGMAARSGGSLLVAETFAERLSVFRLERNGKLRLDHAIPLGDGITPDGICVDAEDGIWVAAPMTSEIVYVDADDSVTRYAIDTPPYACMLGGDDRRTLFVAVAPDHEPANRRRAREARIEAVTVEVPGTGADGLGGPLQAESS